MPTSGEARLFMPTAGRARLFILPAGRVELFMPSSGRALLFMSSAPGAPGVALAGLTVSLDTMDSSGVLQDTGDWKLELDVEGGHDVSAEDPLRVGEAPEEEEGETSFST